MKTLRKKERIIVVGGGISGLACARALLRACGDNCDYEVILVEGRDRVGGRIHTDRSLDGVSVDLGAAWIHGPEQNPIADVARECGMLQEPYRTDFSNSDGNRFLVFDRNGKKIQNVEEYTKGYRAVDESYDYLEEAIQGTAEPQKSSEQDHHHHQQPPLPPSSVKSMSQLNEYGLPGIEKGIMTQDRRDGIYFRSKIRAIYEENTDLEYVDWKLGHLWIGFEGGDLVLTKDGGYKRIIDGLISELEKVDGPSNNSNRKQCLIKKNHIVDQIYYDPKCNKTTISGYYNVTDTPEKNRKPFAYTADRVVVTVPLGVLQSNLIQFSPPLPVYKQTVIQRMGMGQYEKLVLQFPYQFWPNEPHFIHNCPPEEHERQGLFSSFFNYAHYTNRIYQEEQNNTSKSNKKKAPIIKPRPILVCYHAGPGAQIINTWDDATLIYECMQVLNRLFRGGDGGSNASQKVSSLPYPVDYIRTSWENDKLSRGGYTYTKIGQEQGDQRSLGKSLHGSRLLFAGEATSEHHWGSVHGAYITGMAAAKEIIERNKKQQFVTSKL